MGKKSSRDRNSAARRVVIVGGGFAGLSCAKRLERRAKSGKLEVMLIDRRNHHLFQPLLYQVAMAGLSPAEIAAPIRGLLRAGDGVEVLHAEVESIDLDAQLVHTNRGDKHYDYLLLAAGAQHSYFGHSEWEPFAPGLKTLEQATEIRRRVLTAFERAESETDPAERKALLTFVVVGGGPTGVELAGAIGEMSRFTLARDYSNIDPKLTRVILVEAGPRILPSFTRQLSERATRDLEKLGAVVWTESRVTGVDAAGVQLGEERVSARTVLWAAGVQASPLGQALGAQVDRQGRVPVKADLTLEGHPNVFIAGDQARFVPGEQPSSDQSSSTAERSDSAQPLPGVATVALQQGRFVADAILATEHEKPRGSFSYWDKGQLATIGRSRAILQSGNLRLAGFLAWVAWLFVHIYYLSGFKNRLFVLLQWAWSYVTFARGARLITERRWRSYN